MQTIIIHRIATTVAMPLVAASGFAGYSHYQQPPQVAPVCTVLAIDVPTQSANASDVVVLQRFLVARGYMRGTATGYFGQATLLALERFQADNGIPVTGVADSVTRSLISAVSCGGTPSPIYSPSYPPQPYPVTGGYMTIQGVDAPSSLVVGQSGTWGVRVLSYQGAGQLHYGVAWGDENGGVRANSQYAASPVQSSGTFTHTYARAGTYTQVFTVTDGYGHQTQATVTTYVSAPVYTNTPYSYPYTGYSYPSASYSNVPPSGCTSYYDRNCYVNNQYVGPSYGGGSTYNGPGDTCYFVNGAWQGNCGNTSANYSGGYTTTIGGPSGPDYSCYYDRACLASMQGRGY
jgi:peptidoglycan hydrolase-like protein with peptidoglycan-binding domain